MSTRRRRWYTRTKGSFRRPRGGRSASRPATAKREIGAGVVCSDVACRVALPKRRVAIWAPHCAPRHRVVIKSVGLRVWFVRIMGDGRGNLRAAKTPPLQSALRGGRCDACGTDHHLRQRRDAIARVSQTIRVSCRLVRLSMGTANGEITTRRAASLRPPRNGRIGFRSPYSKRETAAKGP